MIRSIKSGYRKDIDGLRALAIISVMLYHYESGFLQGGFIGVDVFFVISGYLITQIVRRNLIANSFSFAGFYVRRIKRIAPALTVMMLVTTIVGWFIFLPVDFSNVGKAVISNSLFSSNVLFWRESGYFDLSAHLNPLLHTWSLAVEEQFYFFLPAILFILRRSRMRASMLWVGLGSLASFALCAWMQELRPTATFYLMPFRAWELGVGVLIALIHEVEERCRFNAEALGWIGLTLLVTSFLLIKPDRNFPGLMAIPPVLGAAFLIYSGKYRETAVARILSCSPLVGIGLVSYSLYLWHWPVYVYATYLNDLEPLGAKVWQVAVLAIMLAIASYKLIELPIRYGFRTALGRNVLGAYATTSFVLVGLGGLVFLNNGFTSRFSPTVVAYDSQRNPEIPYQSCLGNLDLGRNMCRIGKVDAPPTVMLWGDSHALAWAPIVNQLAQNSSALIFSYQSACPPLIDVINPVSFGCLSYNDEIVKLLEHHSSIRKVILHASWTSYSIEPGQYRLQDRQGREGNDKVFEEAIKRTVKRLRELGKEVVILGPTPTAPAELPLKLAFATQKGSSAIPPRTSYADYKSRTAPFYKAINPVLTGVHVTLLDPSKYLCDESYCNYQHDGNLIYRDPGHLSYPGALFLSEQAGLAALR